MAGLLPGTRPLSANFGPDMVDDKPVEDTDRELAAENFNALKADSSYAARMTPLLKVRVANDGVTATVEGVIGPESVVPANVTVVRTGVGVVTIDWSATGVVGDDVVATSRNGVTPGAVFVRVVGTTTAEVSIIGPVAAPALLDTAFTVWVY